MGASEGIGAASAGGDAGGEPAYAGASPLVAANAPRLPN
jgi:hypothetical protein